jgi:hypothetical protein
MDLATGTAGVLLALAAALHDEPTSLPFLIAAEPAGACTPVEDAGAALLAGTR